MKIWRNVAGAVAVGLLFAACGSDAPVSSSDDPDPNRIGPQGRVAQFVVECEVSHIAYGDPIVLPWQPGASHQHQFFGNTAVNSDPGYERAIGADTSCSQRLDTASYWTPTLLDADGSRVEAIKVVPFVTTGRRSVLPTRRCA